MDVGWLGPNIGHVNNRFSSYHPTRGRLWIGTKRRATNFFGESRGRIVCREQAQSLAIPTVDATERGFANADCVLKHSCKNRLKIASGATDNLKHLRRGRLLLQRLIHFAGEPCDLCVRACSGGTATRRGLSRIAALQLCRLAASRFNWFAGAPFHRVPRGLTGIVAGRRLTLEVAYSCSLTDRYEANSSSNPLASLRSSVSKPSGNQP